MGATRTRIAAAAAALGATTLVACGSTGTGAFQLGLERDDPNYRGAQLFYEHCSGCHTLDVAAAEGSATKIEDRERIDGPNFNVRSESVENVLYAIRNGGFSGAIMPENIVVGQQAQEIAEFLAEYSGREGSTPTAPNADPGAGRGQ